MRKSITESVIVIAAAGDHTFMAEEVGEEDGELHRDALAVIAQLAMRPSVETLTGLLVPMYRSTA